MPYPCSWSSYWDSLETYWAGGGNGDDNPWAPQPDNIIGPLIGNGTACPSGPYGTYSFGLSATGAFAVIGINGEISLNISHSLTSPGGFRLSYTVQGAGMLGCGMCAGVGTSHSLIIRRDHRLLETAIIIGEADVGAWASYGVNAQVGSRFQSAGAGLGGKIGAGLGAFAGGGYGSSHTQVFGGCGAPA